MLSLLQALAKQYPQQLYFPFKLSKQHYGSEGQGRAASLQPLLTSPLMEEWGAALNDITYPAQRWEGWVGRLSALIAAGDKVSLTLFAQYHVSQAGLYGSVTHALAQLAAVCDKPAD